jgi:hypothetical protein
VRVRGHILQLGAGEWIRSPLVLESARIFSLPFSDVAAFFGRHEHFPVQPFKAVTDILSIRQTAERDLL